MEGFNLIPQTGNINPEKIEKNDSEKDSSNSNKENLNFENLSSKNKKIKVVNSNKENGIQEQRIEKFLIIISIIVFVGVILYFTFLVFLRFNYTKKIQDLGIKFEEISKDIDKKELESFALMNSKLLSIQEKLLEHILFTKIIYTVNQNIRSSIQVSEYRIESSENSLLATLSCISPGFKDLAEQAEKLFELKKGGEIKSFSISGISYEQDTKRVRFTLKLNLDKSKFSALNDLTPTQQN